MTRLERDVNMFIGYWKRASKERLKIKEREDGIKSINRRMTLKRGLYT